MSELNNNAENEGNSWYTAAPQESVAAPCVSVPAEETQEKVTAPSSQKKRSNGIGKGVIALVLICSILSACLGAGGALFALRQSTAGGTLPEPDNAALASVYMSNRGSTILNTVEVENDRLLTASEVYKANVNSTVGITTEITTTNYWGYSSSSAASGSGFIITEDGYILTNYHVVEDANSVNVGLYDGTVMPAKIAGYDERNDIAVLKIEAEGLTPVLLGNSDELEVGDSVIAIGNPLGELTFSQTGGMVSALNREITMSSGTTMTLIQTDCAINSGNSGGPLFNLYGEVIGITNAKYSSSSVSSASIDNIGFAIPINSVMHLVEQIIEKGYITYPYIGVSVTTVSTESRAYGIPAGAAVASVVEDGPAAKAGLLANDIITAFDGEAIESSSALVEVVGKTAPGEEHAMTIYRQGETIDVKITIGERIQTAEESQNEQQSGQSQQQSQQGYQGSVEDFFRGFGFPGF